MNLRTFLKLLKRKFTKSADDTKDNPNKLTTRWFINCLPNEISKYNDAKNLVEMPKQLDSMFTAEDFTCYIKYTSKEERELLGKKMIELVEAYLQYELHIHSLLNKFINSDEFSGFSEESINAFSKYIDDNFKEIKYVLTSYNVLINLICQ